MQTDTRKLFQVVWVFFGGVVGFFVCLGGVFLFVVGFLAFGFVFFWGRQQIKKKNLANTFSRIL